MTSAKQKSHVLVVVVRCETSGRVFVQGRFTTAGVLCAGRPEA